MKVQSIQTFWNICKVLSCCDTIHMLWMIFAMKRKGRAKHAVLFQVVNDVRPNVILFSQYLQKGKAIKETFFTAFTEKI